MYPFKHTFIYAEYLYLPFPLWKNRSILHTVLHFVFLTYLPISENVPDWYLQKYRLIIFIAALYSGVWKYHKLSSKFPIDEHLSCFQYFAITLHSAVTILVHVSLCTHGKLSVG